MAKFVGSLVIGFLAVYGAREFWKKHYVSKTDKENLNTKSE